VNLYSLLLYIEHNGDESPKDEERSSSKLYIRTTRVKVEKEYTILLLENGGIFTAKNENFVCTKAYIVICSSPTCRFVAAEFTFSKRFYG